MSNGPKPLFFDDKHDADLKAKKEAIEEEKMKELEEVEQYKLNAAMGDLKQALANDGKRIKPLDLSHTSAPAPRPAANPTALFDTKPVAYVSAAVKLANEKFANLGGTNLESVERQIKALLPLSITTVITWGEPGISQEADLVTKAAALLKQFSELRGNELCENALKASTQPAAGFFQRLTGGHTSVIGYKPNLIALKSQIISILPQCDEFTAKMDTLHTKLAINLAALSSACDAVGTIDDSSLSMAVDNRRRLLAQCVQQSDLTGQQLKQMKNLIVSQMAQISQLLDVTIPAVETANATR